MAALSLLGWGIDLLLAFALLWVAGRAFASPDLFKAVVLFIAFGLLLAIVWVRLDAPDIALAEAAIGAGLTGALLLVALARLQRAGRPNAGHVRVSPHQGDRVRTTPEADRQIDAGPPPPSRGLRWLVAALAGIVAAGLAHALLALPPTAEGLRGAVAERMDESGVSHPVTAVLLNFRSYDTWLELTVLLLALIAVWSLRLGPPAPQAAPRAVLDRLTRLVVPLMVLVAGYLLWAGAAGPGGAFQAGAVLAAAGVLLLLAGWRLPPRLGGWPLRLVLVSGVAGFALIGVAAMATGRRLLEYPPETAGVLILLIEAAATLAIGAGLAAIFHGARPGSGS